MSKPAPVLRYPGAKWRMAEWIVSNMPPHQSYLEPFFGSGAVLFHKPISHVETVSDVSGDVVNFFRVLRDNQDELIRATTLTPWARDEYNTSYERTGNELEDARRFLVRCWQAHGTKTDSKTGWRNDVQGRPYTSCAKVWRRVPDRIATIADRLRDVQIENSTALKVIARFAFPEVLIYADPPYPLSTRAGKMYANEMTDADHIELLGALKNHPGAVMLSGYDCQLYNERLNEWTRREFRAQAEKGIARVEVLWINPIAAKSLQMRLFDER